MCTTNVLNKLSLSMMVVAWFGMGIPAGRMFYALGFKEEWCTVPGFNWDPYRCVGHPPTSSLRFGHCCATCCKPVYRRGTCYNPYLLTFANILWIHPWSLWGEDLESKYSSFFFQADDSRCALHSTSEGPEAGWDLRPSSAVLAPGQTTPQATKYRETIKDCK